MRRELRGRGCDAHSTHIRGRMHGCDRGSTWELRLEAGPEIGLVRTHPRMVSRTLIQKSTPQPEMMKTPSGGTECFVSESVLCKYAPRLQAAGHCAGLQACHTYGGGVSDQRAGGTTCEESESLGGYLLKSVMIIKHNVEQVPAMVDSWMELWSGCNEVTLMV